PIEQRHMDVARSIQVVTEEVMLNLTRHTRELTVQKNLCMAGGVALNCVANGQILREKIFDHVWIQPAAGDAGGALGAALTGWYRQTNMPRLKLKDTAEHRTDAMQGAQLGPEYSDDEIEAALKARGAVYQWVGTDALLDLTVELL